ncbi:hypothetical protein H4R18_002152 [Coemansia javaensis]|uniref:Uncharacterized protein n=1 Tax=Coemansia javaensis TaxID=2761396 RepID=A0A9W8LI48_9FUNG|nr:hypothetical protein H4R18_002152 [Coemansia javaensis]
MAVAAAVAANSMPLEIMELASELELALAREREDYYSDNDPAMPSLDPAILQSLGRAVRQQCLLQRQQMQRRKSNMHLGLTGGGHDESCSTMQSPEAGPVDAAGSGQDLPMEAMLAEVSQYFTQSGLNLVFPFSARWVDWLTRHPERPFPWRKDPDDEMDPDDVDSDGDGIGGGAGAGGNRGGGGGGARSDISSFCSEPPGLSRPLPPDDVLSIAMIPMSKRRPARVTDFVTQEKRRGINAHWQYYSVINQITTVASGIHRTLQLPPAEADHSLVAHQLAALYQFLGGDFKKYKAEIEAVFDAVKRGLGVQTPPHAPVAADAGGSDTDNTAAEAGAAAPAADAPGDHHPRPRMLDPECTETLREMMANIIIDALYAMNKVAPSKEQPPPNTPAAGAGLARPDQTQQQQQQQQQIPAPHPVSYAISTLKGLPTQPIIRYLAKEMRVVNADHYQQQRRRRGLAHNLSRNNSMGHLRHHHQQQQQQQQYMYQVPPVPPLPNQAAHSAGGNGGGGGGGGGTDSGNAAAPRSADTE